MWTLVVSACAGSTIVMSLALCLCWRRKPPQNEWLGVDGMVTQKNPDENVNHLPSVAPYCAVDGLIAPLITEPHNDSNKRNIATTNTRRSLPDIPSEQGATVNWEPNGDNSSEHYATVGQYQLNNIKRHTLPNGIEARPSISQHSSISQADDAFSPYERVKYDKIKNSEHPYAQLQPTIVTANNNSRIVLVEEGSNVIVEERNLRLEGQISNSNNNIEPAPPPRSRRSSAHSGLLTVDSNNIPAASAVAGGIAASPELPYMTPPVNQPNFSGDSQDSSKGYTSISVREPLANIMAQTKDLNKKRELDPHYATVSDDSDDVYTTIPDPNNQIYTSESETYARIPAIPITVEVEVNQISLNRDVSGDGSDEVSDELYEPAPQPPPPSVDSLKQVAAYSHSRQASSSSSVANIGSPKPEKRQANSPLPPPPPPIHTNTFDFHLDKNQTQRNLDDLYAKVNKNRKKDDSDNEKSPEKLKVFSENNNRRSVNSLNSFEDKIEMKRKEHNYETLKKTRKISDPGYEKIRHEEPGYASINNNGPDSLTSSDPGYEVLKQKRPFDLDPNYEELNHSNLNRSYFKCNTAMDGYSVVNKQRKTDENKTSSNEQDLNLDEPNYESMPSESPSEHNYAAVKSGSDTDPNYESVCQNDSNYESVIDEPPYERLNDDDSSKTDSGYEKVLKSGGYDTSESSNGACAMVKNEPPYEKLNNENNGYERINNNFKEPNYSTIKSDKNLLDEDAIFQV